MSYLKNVRKSIIILLSICTLISSIAIGATKNLNANKEVMLNVQDTTRTEVVQKETKKASDEQEDINVKSSNLAYNIIYYLISVFIDTNPMSRPR